MRVLGVDCGSRITGYGIIDADASGCVFVHCGVIRMAAGDALATRLKSIHHGLSGVIRSYRPDVVAFESMFHAVNVQSALRLGHARGVSMYAAAEAELPVYEYSPTEVKSAVTGYGRAEKPQVQQMIRSLLKLESLPKQYDASDALAVAICHAHSDRFRKAAQV
jgi:crossover junction endodeoxyribonuclease RuvC